MTSRSPVPFSSRQGSHDRDLLHIAENQEPERTCSRCRRGSANQRGALRHSWSSAATREVARSIANNHHAQLSDNAFTTLVKRAEQDGVLAEKGRHAHRHSATAVSRSC